MANLIGTASNQVPTNGDLGTMAYQDVTAPTLGSNIYQITDTTNVKPSLMLDFANAKSLDSRIRFQRTARASYVAANGNVVVAGPSEPRFDHDPITGVCKGILIEDQRTNICTNIDNIAATISRSGITNSATTSVAPDGYTGVTKLTIDTGTGYHYVTNVTGNDNSISMSVGSTYTYSVFIKPEGIDDFAIGNSTTGGAIAVVNLRNRQFYGFYGGQLNYQLGATITPYPNNWYRVSVTWVAQVSSVSMTIYSGFGVSTSVLGSTTGDGTSGFYLWGSQMEVNTYASSYIKPIASGVQTTRIQDTLQYSEFTGTPPTFSYSGTALSQTYNNTFFVDATLLDAGNNPGTYRPIFSIDDGSSNNYIQLSRWRSGIGTGLYCQFRGNGLTNSTLDASPAVVPDNTRFKVAVSSGNAGNINGQFRMNAAYNGSLIYRNGVGVSVNSAAQPTARPVEALMGNYVWGDGAYNGWISKVAYYPYQLSDNEILEMTR